MNSVNLIGRWTRDPEMRFTQNGKALTKVSIAVNRTFGEGADFFEVVIWGKIAENTAQYTKKGSKVGIEGRLQQETWEKDGQKRSKVVIVAERVEFLDNKNSQSNPNNEIDGFQAIDDDDDIPF
ncbi:single-stranded DNA-binding protein (plasmid) [Crassaminicella thermophila]|uniref:Single-stranded DNA-binding protein n=1 Tax=Crassaminicella thermophila TaxID=2599308 RepID=A0A5C0SJ93_CRATE|nr:single-stranded DNA-binding protein [Crassaminicella thermophila]QEK13767.1 single-stranded DNA-binding protein [Crassaminicella thermophila]